MATSVSSFQNCTNLILLKMQLSIPADAPTFVSFRRTVVSSLCEKGLEEKTKSHGLTLDNTCGPWVLDDLTYCIENIRRLFSCVPSQLLD